MARLFASNFISRVLPAAPARGSAKPPNILILCDSVATSRGQTNGSTTDGAYFQQTKSDLTTCNCAEVSSTFASSTFFA